ncbi:hypothetical protein GCM10010965_14590 [Caldalkalibacillus thermarum]|uniref:hypothetical protein n=1 Tax=Caldalkalibacillus thermarum TaxID=296745 RepID=UPI00166638D7|nr:hypothetical protein [Caldalkalibacillus thermarum]GGK22786.1 hypothetical protein GCM10010965_14590 [Caldalkalibacillus thermarum]
MNEVRLKEIETNWKTWGMWADEGTKYPIERDDVNEVLELVAEIRRLHKQNKRYREALEKISDMHRLTHSATDAIEVAKKALEGEQ